MPELEHDSSIVWPSYNKSCGAARASAHLDTTELCFYDCHAVVPLEAGTQRRAPFDLLRCLGPGSSAGTTPTDALVARAYSANTNSMVWLRCSLSSGVKLSARSEMRLSPERMATYCLPPTSKVIGGAG